MTAAFFITLCICFLVMIIITSISAVSAFASNKTLGGCHPYNCNPVPCAVAPSVMCYTVYNVNVNHTIQLANPLSYPNTTLNPDGCRTYPNAVLLTPLEVRQLDIEIEKSLYPVMYASDLKDVTRAPIDVMFWCGIEK